MNRFTLGAALAVALGLGTASKADAQIVYGYSVPTLSGNLATGGTAITPSGGYGTFNNWYSPWNGVSYGQSSYLNPWWGTGVTRTYGYNPFVGNYGTNYTFTPYGAFGTNYVVPPAGFFGPTFRPGFNITPGGFRRR